MVRPDVGAAVAARLADEMRLQIGQAHVVGTAVGADGDRMRAFVIGAVDQQAANTGGPAWTPGARIYASDELTRPMNGGDMLLLPTRFPTEVLGNIEAEISVQVFVSLVSAEGLEPSTP
jgi:hypothetical protein